MFQRRLTLLTLMFAAAFAVGCASVDRQIIHSTAQVPKTVNVIDASSQQSLWSLDVPPEHTLVLNANQPHDTPGLQVANSPATSMTWKLYRTKDAETAFTDMNDYTFAWTVDRGSIDLTGNPILIDVSLTEPGTISTTLPPPSTPTPPQAAPPPPPAVEEQDETGEAPAMQEDAGDGTTDEEMVIDDMMDEAMDEEAAGK